MLVRKVKLTQDKVALIDDEDYERANQHTWCAFRSYGGKFYAQCRVSKTRTISLHRFIMNALKSKLEVDHIDGNPLNNRKSNLRLVTHAQNQRNFKKFKTNTSGYKGVAWHKARRKWRAYIVLNAKQRHLGLFTSKIRAAKAYDEAARKLFGEFAHLNFKKEQP